MWALLAIVGAVIVALILVEVWWRRGSDAEPEPLPDSFAALTINEVRRRADHRHDAAMLGADVESGVVSREWRALEREMRRHGVAVVGDLPWATARKAADRLRIVGPTAASPRFRGR